MADHESDEIELDPRLLEPDPTDEDGPTILDPLRWRDMNQRATFYLPRGVLLELDELAARTGRSKSQVVTDALLEHIERFRRG